ncbi:hypothetical protein F2Q70_00008067 [Brassica cretica]|uniref:Uncharacterized protein n=1 Tax=Brassica cretica TaxID=69181 RepID=A0A8S9M7R9_BRACR|nr:hypothetical protein F2Q70_00008067 [Brassica cretica]
MGSEIVPLTSSCSGVSTRLRETRKRCNGCWPPLLCLGVLVREWPSSVLKVDFGCRFQGVPSVISSMVVLFFDSRQRVRWV